MSANAKLSVKKNELERFDELESVHSDGEIVLNVLRNYPHLFEFTLQRFDNQVTIIALEVMYDHRQFPLKLWFSVR